MRSPVAGVMKPRACVDCGLEFPEGTSGNQKRCSTCGPVHKREDARRRQRERRQRTDALQQDQAYRRALVALAHKFPDEFDKLRRRELRRLAG